MTRSELEQESRRQAMVAEAEPEGDVYEAILQGPQGLRKQEVSYRTLLKIFNPHDCKKRDFVRKREVQELYKSKSGRGQLRGANCDGYVHVFIYKYGRKQPTKVCCHPEKQTYRPVTGGGKVDDYDVTSAQIAARLELLSDPRFENNIELKGDMSRFEKQPPAQQRRGIEPHEIKHANTRRHTTPIPPAETTPARPTEADTMEFFEDVEIHYDLRAHTIQIKGKPREAAAFLSKFRGDIPPGEGLPPQAKALALLPVARRDAALEQAIKDGDASVENMLATWSRGEISPDDECYEYALKRVHDARSKCRRKWEAQGRMHLVEGLN